MRRGVRYRTRQLVQGGGIGAHGDARDFVEGLCAMRSSGELVRRPLCSAGPLEKARPERCVDLTVDRGLLQPQFVGYLPQRARAIIGEQPQEAKVGRAQALSPLQGSPLLVQACECGLVEPRRVIRQRRKHWRGRFIY